jgi:class 3 adenylate cyclase
VVFAGTCAITFPIFVSWGWAILRTEGSPRYGAMAAVAAAAMAATAAAVVLPGIPAVWGPVEGWAAGSPSSARRALESTYDFARGFTPRFIIAWSVSGPAVCMAWAMIAGANGAKAAQWAAFGATLGLGTALIAGHHYVETFLRPVRESIGGAGDAADDLPRSRPSYATWSTVALLAALFVFAEGGFGVALALHAGDRPLVGVTIALGLVVGLGAPITFAAAIGPSLRPIRDLEAGARRVAEGDFTGRVPVVQDDDLGVLAASFNRMQAGLAERERLHAAFGSYVDPALAKRLLAQPGDLFSGERVEVTVMFVDIRDFTPFAEAHSAEDTVAHLNALFEIVVTVTNIHHGHVNKFLGDGAMVVFGAPERLDDHADQALAAATEINRQVAARFGSEVRIGIGINTGTTIAGTVGGAGKLEFTLIGDAVNVAARVEQLTKTTGDTVLLTQHTLDALAAPPPNLASRGAHALKGKTGTITVHALT